MRIVPKVWATVVAVVLIVVPISPARAADVYADNADLTAAVQESMHRMDAQGVVISTKQPIFGPIETVFNPRVRSFPVNTATIVKSWRLTQYASYHNADSGREWVTPFGWQTQNENWLDTYSSVLIPSERGLKQGLMFPYLSATGFVGTILDYDIYEMKYGFQVVALTQTMSDGLDEEVNLDGVVYKRFTFDVFTAKSNLIYKLVASTETSGTADFVDSTPGESFTIKYNYNVASVKQTWTQALKSRFNSVFDESTLAHGYALNKAIMQSQRAAEKGGLTVFGSVSEHPTFMAYEPASKSFVNGIYNDAKKNRMFDLQFDEYVTTFESMWKGVFGYMWAEYKEGSITYDAATRTYVGGFEGTELFRITLDKRGLIASATYKDGNLFFEDESAKFDLKFAYQTNKSVTKKWLAPTDSVKAIAEWAVGCESWAAGITSYTVHKDRVVCSWSFEDEGGEGMNSEEYVFAENQSQKDAIAAFKLIQYAYTKAKD